MVHTCLWHTLQATLASSSCPSQCRELSPHVHTLCSGSSRKLPTDHHSLSLIYLNGQSETTMNFLLALFLQLLAQRIVVGEPFVECKAELKLSWRSNFGELVCNSNESGKHWMVSPESNRSHYQAHPAGWLPSVLRVFRWPTKYETSIKVDQNSIFPNRYKRTICSPPYYLAAGSNRRGRLAVRVKKWANFHCHCGGVCAVQSIFPSTSNDNKWRSPLNRFVTRNSPAIS